MAKRQFYGVKYPFTNDMAEMYYVDLNKDKKAKVRSQIMHVVFTPKGQYIRNPEFGTDLIRHIFEPNDSVTWEAVKTEVRESVAKWIPDVVINNVSVVSKDDEAFSVFVRLDYSVRDGNKTMTDSIVTKI